MSSNKPARLSLWKTLFLVALITATIIIVRQQRPVPYQTDSGMVFGTVYNITYQSEDNLKADIEQVLQAVDCSLSPFNDSSIISRVNRNEETALDTMFVHVFTLAQQVAADTRGAFDITVAPLVNAWGFGFSHGTEPTDVAIDSLMAFVGYDKVGLTGEGTAMRVWKSDARTMLDCSAIAKGYGCDAVAAMLRSRGVDNFMVEIGGEVVTAGVNTKGAAWRIGIAKPDDDTLAVKQEMQTVVSISDKALATSGNYRNFYYKDGRKYAHTIDPATGRPVQHSLLSATVIAADCTTADAYATAFMVMGLERAQELLTRHPELSAYLIYADENGEYRIVSNEE